jgi:hypothetical protein
MFIKCSTCFEQHNAHHQELKTVIAASSFMPAFLMSEWELAEASSHSAMTKAGIKLEAAITVLSS